MNNKKVFHNISFSTDRKNCLKKIRNRIANKKSIELFKKNFLSGNKLNYKNMQKEVELITRNPFLKKIQKKEKSEIKFNVDIEQLKKLNIFPKKLKFGKKDNNDNNDINNNIKILKKDKISSSDIKKEEKIKIYPPLSIRKIIDQNIRVNNEFKNNQKTDEKTKNKNKNINLCSLDINKPKDILKNIYKKILKIKKNRKIIKLKIGKEKVKKIIKNINSNKYSFHNVKKCLAYSIYYSGNENKKLLESIIKENINENIENNNNQNGKEIIQEKNDNEFNLNSKNINLEKNENLKSIKINKYEIGNNKDIDEDLVNIGDNSYHENILKESKNLKISILTSSINKTIQINYPEIPQTHEVKISSPLCNKCYRIVFIFFNFMKNYITTYCPYCENILIYKPDIFINKINGNKSIISDCTCNECYRSFIYTEKDNPFALVEENNKLFTVLCSNCLQKKENIKKANNIRIIQFEDLIESKPFIYDKIINDNNKNNNNNDNINNENNINDIEKKTESYNDDINNLLFLIQGNENNINIMETNFTYIPFSLKEKYENKIKSLKQFLYIKKKILNYYNEFNNFVTRINMLSSLNTIINLSSLKLYKLIFKNNDLNEERSIELVNKLLKCEDFPSRKDIIEIKKYFEYNKLTKNYSSEEEYINDKNHAKEEEVDTSFEDILKINLITGEGIRFNISNEECFCEEIVLLSYSYNLNYNSTSYQDVIIYNFKQDKNLYYALYNIQDKKIEKESLMPLLNEQINGILKLVLINNANDIFLIVNKNVEVFRIKKIAYYISNFRVKPLIHKYEIDENYKIIYNDFTICIQTKKRLMFMSRIIKKDMNICKNQYNIDDININNLGQQYYDIQENNNMINEDQNDAIIQDNNNIQNEINNIIQLQNNLIEAFGGDEEGLFENLNNLEQLANNFNNINLPPLQASTIFQVNEEGIKSNFIDIFKIDENYFIVLLVKMVKKANIPLKAYFYLSLFDFETLEENTKIEFDLLQIEQGTKFRSYICLERENIKINIGIIKIQKPLEEKNYFFHFENKELFIIE